MLGLSPLSSKKLLYPQHTHTHTHTHTQVTQLLEGPAPLPHFNKEKEFQLWLQVKDWSLGWKGLYADWRIANRRSIRPADRRTICRSKNYLQLEDLFAGWRTVYKSNKYLICTSKNCLQIEELFPDERIVCRLNDYSIGRLKNDLQIEEVFHLQIEELYANWQIANPRSIQSADQRTICRLKRYLQIEELLK